MHARLVLLAASTLMLAAAAALTAHETEPSTFTYQKDVFPILKKHCGDCHRPGGIAPMTLLSYQEAFPWAASMKTEVLEGRMPPWLPEEGYGEFRGARSLTAEEIDILVDWASGGTPEGAPLEADQASAARESGTLGERDLILQPEHPVTLDSEEIEKSVCVVLPTGLEDARWITTFDFEPGVPGIVHNVTVFLGDGCGGEARPVASWLPGQGAYVVPDGLAEKLPAGGSLALDIHYRKTWRDDGKEMTDRSRLGLDFVSDARPVGAAKMDESTEVRKELALLAIYPAPTEAGPFEVAAEYPDGEREPLLRIESFDPSWRGKYVFQQPVRLQPGTVLSISSPAAWVDYVERVAPR